MTPPTHKQNHIRAAGSETLDLSEGRCRLVLLSWDSYWNCGEQLLEIIAGDSLTFRHKQARFPDYSLEDAVQQVIAQSVRESRQTCTTDPNAESHNTTVIILVQLTLSWAVMGTWRGYLHVVVIFFTTKSVLLKLISQVHKDDITELRQPAISFTCNITGIKHEWHQQTL